MRDPKAIKKAIMTAKSVARLIDPHFGRVPMPNLGKFGGDEPIEEHSPMIHAAYDVPMSEHFAGGGDVKPYQDPEASHISEWNWRPLEDVRSDLGYMREIPSHVLKFGDFMDEIAQRASNQGLTPRDLIKAYTITRSSIQRRAAKTDKVRQAGLPLHDFHDEMIRPEGAFGEWLHSPAGQAYLDAAEKGQVHHGAIEDAVRVMAPFGKHEKDIPDALSWAAVHLPGNEGRVSELIHAGRLKASHPSEWRDFTSGIRGIGPSKSGFYASLLGRGDQPTLDARQIILHTGRPTKEATRFLSRKGGAGGVEAVNRLTARQEAMGLELPDRLSPYYQHLAHHAVWDQAGGDETTHEDVMRSMRHAASGGAIMPHDHWVGQILHRLDNSDAELFAAGGDVEDNRAAFLEGNHPLVPHVVYHGTDRNITQFDTEQPRRIDAGGLGGLGNTTDTGWYGKGHYFTPSPEAASNFASNYAVTGEHGPNVLPVHLSLKNPFIVKVPRSSSGATEMDNALDKVGAPQSSDERLLRKGRGERLPSEQTKILREMGHDGVIVMQQFGHRDAEAERRAEEHARMAERLHREAADEYYDAFGDHDNPDRIEAAKEAFIRTRRAAAKAREEAGGEYRPAEFVVFEPHQIKSASGNRGTYDPSNPDIRYASGGEVDDQHPYAVPNDLGLYSHAAVTAAGLPQERGTPEQFRGMLLNKGVKPAELHWGEYDYAFGDKPEVTRDEVAKHLWASMPNIEEKVLRRKQRGEPSASEISEKHYRERQSLYDEDLSPAEINQRRREMRERHAAERASAWHRDPHHEFYTIPGGENYREILLKHGSGGMYPGVDVHFGGEPDILTSMMVKDRQDHEGDKVLHVDELQSDWAQKGRQQGFKHPSPKILEDYVRDLSDRFEGPFREHLRDQGEDDESIERLLQSYKTDAASMAHFMGESDKLNGLVQDVSNAKHGIVEPAPYVTKTEDWVDLGLKRALREAAEKGYDKLAWSPGSTIANRYDLAKHVGMISHEKNEDGTYNLEIKDKDGQTILDREDMSPEDVAAHLGKGVADQIFAGEGETGKEAYEKYAEAKKVYDDFMDKAASAYANAEMEGADLPEDSRERMHRAIKKVAVFALSGRGSNDPEDILRDLGMLDDYHTHRSNMVDASIDMDMGPLYSPYRDWRHIKPESLQIGEKWPFEMYDRMIPKRALRLAKMHDPDAQLEKSKIEHSKIDKDPYDNWEPEEEGNVSSGVWREKPAEMTELHAIRITPQMRESILKKGFPAYAQGGEVEGHEVANPMSIFPKPQRMWDEDMPGGAYLSMPDKRDVTGHKASSASIGIGEDGKPYFNASRDPAEVTGSPGRGSATVKTNLFKQKAGWKWLDTPDGHENTNTLVSVEHRGKHHYVLHAHFPKGVDLARYPDAPSEPRLRPTTKGNVELGPQVGSISVRGKEHPVHAHAIVKAHGGEVEGYADGGDIDPEKIKEALRRIYSPLSDNPEHVQHALKIAQTYSTPLGGETGTGSFYRIKQSMPVSAVTAKVGNIPGINLKPIKKGSWEDFYNRAKGGVMVNVGGDLSGFGRLTHINNKPLAWPVDLHAGADYMREPNKGRVWANIGAHATSFSKKIREAEEAGKEVFGVLSPMGPTAVDSSHNMFDALMAQIPGAEIDPEDLKAFDEAIKRGEHLEADDRKNPKIMAALQQWPGLENAKEVSDFARPSSKKITGANRSSIVKFMGQEKWQKKGFPEVGVTRVAISNPDLVGIGGNKLGYRIARLSSKPIHSGGRSFEHSTYPVDTHGEYLQDVPLVERHHATPDVTEKIITSPYKGGIVAHPYSADDRGRSTYRQLFEQQKQMQPVNQRMLDSIMTAEENKAKYGFKKGGAVRKALMIAKDVKKK